MKYELCVGLNTHTDVNATLETPEQAISAARAFRAACPNVNRVHIRVIEDVTGDIEEIGFLRADNTVNAVPYQW